MNFIDPNHYRQSFDVKEVHRLIGQIPEEMAIGASSNLTPHLAFRKVIYSFPKWEKVDLILLLKTQESYFPFSKKIYEAEITKLRNDTAKYTLKYESDAMLIFAKNNVAFEVTQ